MNIKTAVSPAKELSYKFKADKFFPKKQGEDLPWEKLSYQTIIKFRNFMKLPFFVCASLCEEKMQMRMEIAVHEAEKDRALKLEKPIDIKKD